MTARRLQENYNFCIQGYLQEKGVRFYIPYELEHRHGHFSIKNWPYTDIKKHTNRDLIEILNKNELLKVMKCKTLRNHQQILLVSFYEKNNCGFKSIAESTIIFLIIGNQ